LREFARKSKASKTFIGFGDPKFDIKGKETGTIKDVFLYLDELPESKKELETISKTLGQDKQSFFVQELATEKQLRSKNLFDYKVISFATHGLMAGEFMGLEEPALILTPQDFADNKNNGILYASEIAELKLDAQWVILSACNTAAPSGKPGAEGLSGLAKAFFYAGSRSLLVSNWMVETNASVKITTKIFEILKQNPNINKSQALRNSIINLRNSGEKMYLHPMFWAPFSIVGDGRKMSSKL
jgi:CHAT domain-containing protein